MADFHFKLLPSEYPLIIRRLLEGLHLQFALDLRWPTASVPILDALGDALAEEITRNSIGVHLIGHWTKLPLHLLEVTLTDGSREFTVDSRRNETISLTAPGGYEQDGILHIPGSILSRESHCVIDDGGPPRKISDDLRKAYDAAVRLVRHEFLCRMPTTPVRWGTGEVQKLLLEGRARVLVAGTWIGRESLPDGNRDGSR